MTINDSMKNFHARPVPIGKKFTSDRIDSEGRLRIAAFIYALLGWDGPDVAEKLLGSGRVSRTTLDRVKRGDNVSDTMLRAMGDVLDLPRDYLLYIGRANVDRIERLLPEANDDLRDLIRWTLDLFEPEPDDESVSA